MQKHGRGQLPTCFTPLLMIVALRRVRNKTRTFSTVHQDGCKAAGLAGRDNRRSFKFLGGLMAQPQRRSWWNFNQCLRLEGGGRYRRRRPRARADRSWRDGGVVAHVVRTRATRPKRRGHVATDARSAQWRAPYASTARFPDRIHPPPPHPASSPIRPHGQRRRRCIQVRTPLLLLDTLCSLTM